MILAISVGIESANTTQRPHRGLFVSNLRLLRPCFGRLLWAALTIMLAGAIAVLGTTSWLLPQQSASQTYTIRIPEQHKAQAYIVLPYLVGNGPLAHYTEHLAWLPNIGKNSRPEDRDSNAVRVSETRRNRKDGQECLTMS